MVLCEVFLVNDLIILYSFLCVRYGYIVRYVFIWLFFHSWYFDTVIFNILFYSLIDDDTSRVDYQYHYHHYHHLLLSHSRPEQYRKIIYCVIWQSKIETYYYNSILSFVFDEIIHYWKKNGKKCTFIVLSNSFVSWNMH